MLLPNKKYNIIYADPPWHFENWNNKTAQTNPNQHYPTMTMKDIANMKVMILLLMIVFCLCGALILY